MKRILLTGAAGRIGSAFYAAAKGRYQFTLCDLNEPTFVIDDTDVFEAADLTSASQCARLAEGQDAIVHLAGVPRPEATFEQILPANILATTHLMGAAATSRVNRFVFASSAQAIEGNPVDLQIADGSGPLPANLYGVSKAYGEALGSYHAYAHGLSCVAIRIGAFEPEGSKGVATRRDLSAWLSPKDAVHLIERAIEADLEGFFVAHGISDNRFKRLELTATRERLGYAPSDDAFAVFELPASG